MTSGPENIRWCTGCGVEIGVGGVTVLRDAQAAHYCCQDCLEGRPCDCGVVLDEDEHTPTPSPQVVMGT